MDDLEKILSSDPAKLRLHLEAEKYRRSLAAYTQATWPLLEPGTTMLWGWPLDAICEHLEAVSRREIKRLVVNVPPGSMKSLLTGPFFSSWEWTHTPYSRFIRASYSAHLAERDTAKARRIITSDWYKERFPVKLLEDQGGKTNFANEQAGSMFATSVGGVGTGERGNYFMIDDPHSIQKAESPADRARTLHWFAEVVPSRLNNLENDVIVVIMQRVHEDDVTGYALSNDLGYEHLCIPMHYDEQRSKTTSIGWSDPRKKDGELMWPERFSEKAVNVLMTGLGPYGTACQLDQWPVPREGGMFLPDRIRQIEDVDAAKMKTMNKVRAWDLAGTEKRGAYTVGVLMGHDPDAKQYYILDVRREQLSPGRVRDLVKRIAEKDGPGVKIILPQDPGQAGKSQIQEYIADLEGFSVKSELQSGSKELRAEAFAAQVDIAAVSALERHWLKSFLDELRMFPKGKFKDQVDAASSAFNELARMTRRKKQSSLELAGERLTLFSGM